MFIKASKDIGSEAIPKRLNSLTYMIKSRPSKCSTKSRYSNWKFIIWECGKVQISESNSSKYKRRINIRNACYYSVEKILSSRLLSKILKVNRGLLIKLLAPGLYYQLYFVVVKLGLSSWERSVVENKLLVKIFGAKRDEITGEWRKLHNAELHALYSSPIIIRNLKSRRLRWAGHLARMEQFRNA